MEWLNNRAGIQISAQKQELLSKATSKKCSSEPTPRNLSNSNRRRHLKSSNKEPMNFLNIWLFQKIIYTDQTGHFPVTLIRGYKYMMIARDFYSNNILAEPLKSWTGLHTKNSYQKIWYLFCICSLKPQLRVLDNECSQHLKEYMLDENNFFNSFRHIYMAETPQNEPSKRSKPMSLQV